VDHVKVQESKEILLYQRATIAKSNPALGIFENLVTCQSCGYKVPRVLFLWKTENLFGAHRDQAQNTKP